MDRGCPYLYTGCRPKFRVIWHSVVIIQGVATTPPPYVWGKTLISNISKGIQMGPLLVLVSLCFRENINVTGKILSILCSLDNFLLKNAIVFFLGNQILIWHPSAKRAIFDLLFIFLVTREKTQTFLQHISHLHTHILLTLMTFFFFAFPILQKNANWSCMVSLWCDSWCWILFAPFWCKQ